MAAATVARAGKRKVRIGWISFSGWDIAIVASLDADAAQRELSVSDSRGPREVPLPRKYRRPRAGLVTIAGESCARRELPSADACLPSVPVKVHPAALRMLYHHGNRVSMATNMRGIGVDETKWLIAKEIPRLRRYALALVNDAAEADDLVQDCLERAIRKRHLWKRRGSMRSWLYRILYHVFINQSTRRNRIRQQTTLEDVELVLSEPARQEGDIIYREIAAAMQALSEDHRAAIVLTAVEGLSYDEAADVLDIPIGTLRSRLSRAREKLRGSYVSPDAGVSLRRVK